MKRVVLALTIALAVGPARLAAAQSPTSVTHVTVTLPNHFQVGSQYYDASVGGLDEYLRDLRPSDPSSAAALDRDVEHLRMRRNGAIAAFVIGAVAGGALILGGASFWADHPHDSLGIESSSPNGPVIGAGFGVLFAGAMTGLALMPHRGDYMEVVNHHNRLRPANPISIQLGLGSLTATF